ncbi:MAG TPA: nitroreductase family protein [Anaerolineae bacterium]|nr:nitroreductase family protein [Anaerolineae bacterium]HQH39965.1 nitroreductase family protein [Anaerolineae bacterium]
MEFAELIQKRYSVRAYASTPVEDEKLQQVLWAAQLAPTAANRQPVRVIVVKTAGRETELRRIYGAEWFVKAPLVLCICGVKNEAWVRQHDGKCYLDVDAAIVTDHIVLMATALGLGTCWIGAFNPDAAREILALPEGVEPILFTPLGYPADNPRPKNRKELAALVKYDHW